MLRFERLPTQTLEAFAVTALAANVLLTAFGSSAVQSLADVGRPGRWLALFALLIVACALAVRSRHGAPGLPLTCLLVVAGSIAFVALVSTGYSVDPRLTLERSVTLVVALSAAAMLGYAAEARPGFVRLLIVGAVAGGATVVAAGVVVYVFDRGAAVQPVTVGAPARWRGLGENPNTISMLAGVDLAGALWLMATTQRRRVLWASAAAGFGLTILASGSRGAFVAGIAGALVVAVATAPRMPQRVAACMATLAIGAVGVALVDAIAKPGRFPPSAYQTHTGTAGQGGGGGGAGTTLPGSRNFVTVTSSGRVAAWRAAFHIGNGRPVLGYGFGTEEKVFVPRFSVFRGLRPENSFLGMYLQLGFVGVAGLVAALLVAAAAVITAFRRGVAEAPALGGMLLAGAALLMVQSYVYAIGNVAAVTFWIAAFASVAAAGGRR